MPKIRIKFNTARGAWTIQVKSSFWFWCWDTVCHPRLDDQNPRVTYIEYREFLSVREADHACHDLGLTEAYGSPTVAGTNTRIEYKA